MAVSRQGFMGTGKARQSAPSWHYALVVPLLALLSTLLTNAEIDPGIEAVQRAGAKMDEVIRQAPPLVQHFEGLTETDVANALRRDQNYKSVLREKARQEWFAALLSTEPENELAREQRFSTWKDYADYVARRQPLVEVWACLPDGKSRRLSASEIGEIRRAKHEQPTFITLSFPGDDGVGLRKYRVEFGFTAAETLLAAQNAYAHSRQLQLEAHEILSSRNDEGKIDADAQARAMADFLKAPPEKAKRGDLFVAAEFEVDSFGNFLRVARFYRESEITRVIREDSNRNPAQVILLSEARAKHPREVMAYRVDRAGEQLVPAPNPIPGVDLIELRVRNENQPDVRMWNVLEFGEPELLRESALSKFSLINAYLDKERKELSLKKSKIDLFAEPAFAGLNIGGGLSGVGFPLGAAARLAYNLAVNPFYIPNVPSPAELRELFVLIHSKEKHPELRTKPWVYLTEKDVTELRKFASQLSEQEIQAFLGEVSENDLQALVRLGKMQSLDAKVSNFLGILTEAGKVSGVSESGVLREIFNSPYFSLQGDINIKTILAIMLGGRVATPLSGTSLQDLGEGKGPAEAWLQFFDVSVNIRAILNTLSRMSHKTLADKELKMPFPYAPRLSDLAAYEVRIFGYPLLIYYKRGLLKDDYAAYQNDYAYGLAGARVVEHFATREDFETEIRERRVIPLGYVRVPDGKGHWQTTRLAVFAHQIPAGKYKGKTSIIIYGLKAYGESSARIEREIQRFKQFEEALSRGAVIEQIVEGPSSLDREPKITPTSASGEFNVLLPRLLELQRYKLLRKWGAPIAAEEQAKMEEARLELERKGILIGADPLVTVDRYHSSFLFMKTVNGQNSLTRMTSIPSVEEIERELAKAGEGARIETLRLNSIGAGGNGIVLLNEARTNAHGIEIGPLIRSAAGELDGAGVRTGQVAIAEVLAAIESLPIEERAHFQQNHFSSSLLVMNIEGEQRAVFLTLEFPIDQEAGREGLDPLTGERQLVHFKDGRRASTITKQRIAEATYNGSGAEDETFVFLNAGTIEKPIKGPLLERTKSIEQWFRPMASGFPDPYSTVLKKIRCNLVTGRVSVESYGLFPFPLEIADDQFVTQNRFNAYGILTAARVLEREGTDLARFVPGRERFQLSRIMGSDSDRTLRAENFINTLRREDLVKDLSTVVLYDTSHAGRKVGERWTELVNGKALTNNSAVVYEEGFYFGLVPRRATVWKGTGERPFATIETDSYDPVSQTFIGFQETQTGRSRLAWDYRSEEPIRQEFGARVTTRNLNRDGTLMSGETLSRSSGKLEQFTGEYDRGRHTWKIQRSFFWKSSTPVRTVEETLSGFGTLLYTRAGNVFETRPLYDNSGLEQGSVTFTKGASGEFDVRTREEEGLAWIDGLRHSRIRTYLDGKSHDEYGTVRDSYGRLALDEIRQFPTVSMQTKLNYDADSDIPVKSEQMVNGVLRVTREQSPVTASAGGLSFLVTIRPAWGLVSTQRFVLPDLYGRPAATIIEDGSAVRIVEWIGPSKIPRISEKLDPSGRATERYILRPSSGTNDSMPFDLIIHSPVTHWGEISEGNAVAVVSGTDLRLFSESGSERTYYELKTAHNNPSHAMEGQRLTRVYDVVYGERSGESIVRSIDLRPPFSREVTLKTFDLAGQTLNESEVTIPNSGAWRHPDSNWAQNLPKSFDTISEYFYEPGWLQEETNTLAFSTNKPAHGTMALPVNQNGRRSYVTKVETFAGAQLRRRTDSPVERRSNPYLPGRKSRWVSWKRTEFGSSGEELFHSEVISDANGGVSVVNSIKKSKLNGIAAKTFYALPPPSDVTFEDGGRGLKIDDNDFSKADFAYFYFRGAPPTLEWEIRDLTGKKVRMGGNASGHASWWEASRNNVRWIPDSSRPVHGAILDADEKGARAVSIADLADAGLDVSHLSAFQPLSPGATNSYEVSPLYRLSSGLKGYSATKGDVPYLYASRSHSAGWRISSKFRANRSERDLYGDRGTALAMEINGWPAAIGPETEEFSKSQLVLMDFSGAGPPRPLYAVSKFDGHFVEHYRRLDLDYPEVFTIVQGFEIPKREVFDPRFLEDETSPGFVAYGYDYHIQINSARWPGLFGQKAAFLHDRIVGNTFNVGSDRLLGWLFDKRAQPNASLDYSLLHTAALQAKIINALPILSENLIPSNTLPWEKPFSSASKRLELDKRRFATALLSLHVKKNPESGLIPTSISSLAERYIDTAEEADYIHSAIALEETSLAKELLEFYWEKSKGGRIPLQSSYDAKSGNAMFLDLRHERPSHASVTAEAQIAIAESAFALARQNGDARWSDLGGELTRMVLAKFRPAPGRAKVPRGIAEHPVIRVHHAYGFAFWPEAEKYRLKTNCRAYLLLKKIEGFSEDAAELEMWLKNNFISQAEKTGVISSGLFQIQDINGGTTALASERWTASDDWLCLIEAAHAMGIEESKSKLWLDNLAKAHGVIVRGVWGLDWGLAVSRSDAISTGATAKFARICRITGHVQAADYATGQLASLQRPDKAFPALFTEDSPIKSLRSGVGTFIHPQTNHAEWPITYRVHHELFEQPQGPSRQPMAGRSLGKSGTEQTDLTVYVLGAAAFYLFLLGASIFWWRFRALRKRNETEIKTAPLVPEMVMQRAEERWAKRVLGLEIAQNAAHTRFSNATVEMNFHMQFKAIYKLVLEWRRQENGWEENDPRLAEDGTDDWLNGMDEFASVTGIYMRWVIKAGAKDGFEQKDPLAENEDSNHIWSRLVMYFSEYYWRMVALMQAYGDLVTHQQRASFYGEISQLLLAMGARQRSQAFDARTLFNYPTNSRAFDLLTIQKPGMTLEKVLLEVTMKLKVPAEHLIGFITKYKEFKRRENPYPIHPYLIEYAKILPHFMLMGLGALVWYNQTIGDSAVVPYLWSVLVQFTREPASLLWAIPLLGGIVSSAAAGFVKTYRWDSAMLTRVKPEFLLDATLTSLFATSRSSLPQIRPGRRWNPDYYEWTGWTLRSVGCGILALTLFQLNTPSIATFLIVKGLLAMFVLSELAAILLPIAGTLFSKFVQDRVHAGSSGFVRFINSLNITASVPASPLWLSIKYHNQPSVLSGSFWSMSQALVFYFGLAAVFFVVGGYLCQQILSLWFTDSYLSASNWKLFFGGLIFWNTMYLLRYGLFLLFTGAASGLATFPIKGTVFLTAFIQLIFALTRRAQGQPYIVNPAWTAFVTVTALVVMIFEDEILTLLRGARKRRPSPAAEASDSNGKLGVIYMSGDDLSCLKLTPSVLMSRLRTLRDTLDSTGLRLLCAMVEISDDAALEQSFSKLYELEKKFEVTLWHPIQLHVLGDSSPLRPESGLDLWVENAADRDLALKAWHARRWLVTMMSTAGHAQDTALTLVDIAVRLNQEGLAPRAVFYLIQNKFDNNDNNRPSQLDYQTGELGQRNKLTALIRQLAPGCSSYSLQNWTPFGFKAGGLTGMDLVFEHSLQLRTMLVLDRNANVHDLDGLMADLRRALSDPDLVIIIPGRGTTNTRTPLGQASQMVEEGHRSFLKGLMTCLGGEASEAVGTGWGNILASYYGRVQRAMLDAETPKMPLTSRLQRGSSFQVRTEGMIGFTPHSVGISEDTWAVSQAAHNAIALGGRVKFLLSTAIWHKMRETWSHSEWLASFPRWSGGYLQMMNDPIMQRINDFGPASVFAKEVRANSGRNFLTAPFALLNIMLMPLAIMLDVTPFVQILVILWNFGFVMNQILTIHGLNTFLETSGFYRIPALLGGAIAGLFCYKTPGLRSYEIFLVVGAFLAGGFLAGLSRWFYTRIRDIILFGPQLVLHALGQIIRQGLEFTVSGASPGDAKGVNVAFRSWSGPREDRPWDGFPNCINLKTVVWVVGVTSLILNLVALSKLDMLNVLLVLPSLLFSVSVLAGPFALSTKPGHSIHAWVAAPKLLAWLAGLLFYIIVSRSIAAGGLKAIAGLVFFVLVFGFFIRHALAYAGYRGLLRRYRVELLRLIEAARPDPQSNERLATAIISSGAGDTQKVRSLLERTGLDLAAVDRIAPFVEVKIKPLLALPGSPRAGLLSNRWASEFSRSFALCAFTLLWLFIVPVPGLFVLTAGEYRIPVGMWGILRVIGVALACAVLSYWLGCFFEWFVVSGIGGAGLKSRIENAYKRFETARGSEPKLTAPEVSKLYALFTDVQTYYDQRSFSYARRSLLAIETALANSGGPVTDFPYPR